MKINLLLANILLIYQNVYILKGIKIVDHPAGSVLFLDRYYSYIRHEQKFTINQAEEYCASIDSQMQNTEDFVGILDTFLLHGIVRKKDEYQNSFWITDGNFTSPTKTPGKCTAAGLSGTFEDDCMSLKGVICSQKIIGGHMQYRNGTHLNVDVDHIIRYCNPQSNRYDHQLLYCLVNVE